MRANIARIAGFAALAATVVSAAPQAQRERRERGILVSVSGQSDTPVTDMTAADFTVRENNVAREVIRVAPAPPPSHVALLVDDSQAMTSQVQYLRPALTDFIAKMAALTPAPQQAVWTFGERPQRRVDFTPNAEGPIDAVKRLFPVNGSGAYFLQCLVDVTKDLKKRQASSPVIVAFVSESGPEFSSEMHTQIAEALKSAGASLWVVTLQQNAVSTTSSTAARERAAVLGDVTRDSGGMNKVVLSGQGIEPGFKALTSLLTTRYLVFYGRPDSLIPPERIEVTSRRANVRVHATRWAGQ